MKQTWLKKIRVAAALAFLALTTLLFVDFERLGEPYAPAVLYLQFVPSLLNFTQTLALAATGFIVVLVATLLFGRVYCSTVCPLGTLQDLVIRLADKVRKPRKVKFKPQKPYPWLRYGVLALTVGLFLSGSTLALSLLDPFSNFGRIVADLLRPLYVAAHNGFGQFLESFGVHGPFPLHWKAPPLATLAFPMLFLLGLIGLSAFKGRMFCNTLCPVGALLGLVARFAMFKIQVPKDACTICAQCSIHCKAGCIRLKTQEVDFSRCVACFNCINVCEAHGIGYARSWPVRRQPTSSTPVSPGERGVALPKPVDLAKRRPSPLNPHPRGERGVSRRTVLRAGVTALVGLAGLPGSNPTEAKPSNRLPSRIVNLRTWPVAPPGAGAIARFNELCTACHLCVSACPYDVLQPALLDYGLSGLLQPHLDFTTGYCSYECNRCGQICPTGAIRPLNLATKQTTQLGVARFVRDNCIVHTDHTACGACDEYCPTKAVHMVPYRDGLSIPQVREELCVGCGACEKACPVRPHRAIYVEGLSVHRQARRPVTKPLEREALDAFPF